MKWLMSLGVVALLGVGGCDQSKQELDSTKAQLSSVSNERDQLAAKNKELQQQLDATKAELAKAKTPATPPTAAAAATPAKPADAKHPADAKAKKSHKS